MKTSESILKIAPAILTAQKNIGVVVKGANNPFFGSHYADLTAVIDAIKPALNNVGIAFIQAVGTSANSTAMIETILLHESGEFISTETPVLCKKPDDPQAMGSGITYSKRYALQALLGLPTEDDDGNAATKNGTAKPAAQQPKPDVNLAKLDTDTGIGYLRKFKTAKDAIQFMSKTHNVTREAHAFITEFFETEAAT